VRIGTDRRYATELRSRILDRHQVLFDHPAVVREFERFFADAVARRI